MIVQRWHEAISLDHLCAARLNLIISLPGKTENEKIANSAISAFGALPTICLLRAFKHDTIRCLFNSK